MLRIFQILNWMVSRLNDVQPRGLYIPDTDRWPTHFRGMGIRIEDSIAVQEEHPYVLTTEAVKEVCRAL